MTRSRASKEESRVISVDSIDGWRIVQTPHIGETTELGPCVGVIIYDPTNRKAMVGHLIDPREGELTRMLADTCVLLRHQASLRVYVGGIGHVKILRM